MQLFHLLYFSKKAPSQPALTQQDQKKFAAKNQHMDLTGLLVECNGHYLQVLEGRRTEVSRLLASIFCDPRHTDLTIARAEQIDARFFQDFEMAHIGEDKIPQEYVRLHFPGQEFRPTELTGSQLWAFMADLV